MIYIYAEDSKAGFDLCKVIEQEYFQDIFQDIQLDTLNGIWNLRDKVEVIVEKIEENDIVIIVYDDVRENPIVDRFINEAADFIAERELEERILWLPTKSFEIEVLLIIGIEFFVNFEKYDKYFLRLRDIYSESGEISELTKESKKNGLYDEMYHKVRKEKLKRRLYQNLSEIDFEASITIETISKLVFKEVFSETRIDKPMGECWIKNCCYRHNQCENLYIDFDKIIQKQKDENLYKTKFIVWNTSYSRLITAVYKMHGKEIVVPEISVEDILREETNV